MFRLKCCRVVSAENLAFMGKEPDKGHFHSDALREILRAKRRSGWQALKALAKNLKRWLLQTSI